ncbi:MAG: MCE family protein [Actinomycetota bacterium]|nr:MCE family protein [Actinomycetota bacterium]
MAKESFSTVVGRRLLGLGFIAVILALVALSVAFYNKAFTPVVTVTLKTDHTGNQLLRDSDVKERGIIVGRVRTVHVDSHGECQDLLGTCSVITLALSPSRAKLIPNNVSAQILPKTLFGEQYVSLQIPDHVGPPIKRGDTISQDRSAVALESQKVIGDLLPLLQAVKPAELNATLNAIATALRGRGEELGRTLVNMDAYLKQLNADASPGTSYVTQLVTDLKKLGQVSVEFNQAAPDLLATLDNLQTGAKTLIQKQAALDTLLTTGANTSDIFDSFLSTNKQRLITVVDTSSKVYGLLDKYTPEYGCMLSGLVGLNRLASNGIVNNQIRLSAQLYVAPTAPGNPSKSADAYRPNQDEPVLLTGIGPHCLGLPNPAIPFKTPGEFRCLKDRASFTNDTCAQAATSSAFNQQAIGSPAEHALVNGLIAGSYGTPDKVPAIATMLAAPALRGMQVTVK